MKILSDIAIIGGLHNNKEIDDVEVISIKKDSISHINSTVPSLSKGLCDLSGAQLPNGQKLELQLRKGLLISQFGLKIDF